MANSRDQEHWKASGFMGKANADDGYRVIVIGRRSMSQGIPDEVKERLRTL